MVKVHRLREVTCLYGFTRLEPPPSSAESELDEIQLAVNGADLSRNVEWLPFARRGMSRLPVGPRDIVGMYRAEVCRAWLHSLRRRSQRARMTWDRFQRYVGRYIPKVRACHRHPNPRYTS
jgi:hypothetical protein